MSIVNGNGNGNGSVWKWIAAVQASILMTAMSGWMVFGVDSIKHSEIDTILQNRAPYVHDRRRIQERLEILDREIDRARNRLERLEQLAHSASKDK